MEKKIIIAIDGHSSCGKSTMAKQLARQIGYVYVDTGAMYRAFGLKLVKNGIEIEESDELKAVLAETDIDFSDGNIYLDGEIVNDQIRTPEASMVASKSSAFASVRKKMVELQQKMAQSKSVIMDGRDIGTVVMKDAEYKFYLTASAEERARRRTAELIEKGQDVDFETVLKDIEQRDYNDMNRAVTPLRKADDAVEIDSTSMTIDEVVNFICDRAEGRVK